MGGGDRLGGSDRGQSRGHEGPGKGSGSRGLLKTGTDRGDEASDAGVQDDAPSLWPGNAEG